MSIFWVSLLVPVIADVNTYRAAVADLTSGRTDADTLAHYKSLTQRAKGAGAKIIVFPEALTWDDTSRQEARKAAQKVPSEGSLPCDGGDAAKEFQQVQYLSCMARHNSIVVVANVLDKVLCSRAPCPEDGLLVYNTAIALSETGHLLAVYHKRHDYPPLDQPPLVPKSFKTSFGVEFGLIVCYDLSFITPVRELIDRGIRNFAFTTNWENEVPLQTATLSQQGWSRWYGANLLASNDAGSLASAGSGIYSAGEVLVRKFDVNGTWPAADSVLLADVPITPACDPLASSARRSLPIVPPSSSVVKASVKCSIDGDDAAEGVCTGLPVGSVGVTNLTVSDGPVHCIAHMDIEEASTEQYMLYASAWRVADKRATDIDVCALMVCQQKRSKKKLIQCTPTFSGSLVLRSLKLHMSASTAKAVVPFVGVGMAENLPRNAVDVSVTQRGFSMVSTPAWLGAVQHRGLLTAALYGTDASAPDLVRSKIIV